MNNNYYRKVYDDDDGLTRLDFFAAAALKGILAHPTWGIHQTMESTADDIVKIAKAVIDAIDRDRAQQ